MADSVSFAINPIVLANMLTNAVEISKEGANITGVGEILVAYQPSADGLVGEVFTYGCGRYAAARTATQLDGLPGGDAGSVSITREHAESLASTLRKTSRTATARVGVVISAEPVQVTDPETGKQSWGNLTVGYQSAYLACLFDSDSQGRLDAIWRRIDDLIADQPGDEHAHITLKVDVLSRLSKIRGGGLIADIRTTPMTGVAKIKLGSDVVALVGEVNRADYRSGGRWSDGPGNPSHLWKD